MANMTYVLISRFLPSAHACLTYSIMTTSRLSTSGLCLALIANAVIPEYEIQRSARRREKARIPSRHMRACSCLKKPTLRGWNKVDQASSCSSLGTKAL